MFDQNGKAPTIDKCLEQAKEAEDSLAVQYWERVRELDQIILEPFKKELILLCDLYPHLDDQKLFSSAFYLLRHLVLAAVPQTLTLEAALQFRGQLLQFLKEKRNGDFYLNDPAII